MALPASQLEERLLDGTDDVDHQQAAYGTQ